MVTHILCLGQSTVTATREIRGSNFPDTSGRGVALVISSKKEYSKVHMGECDFIGMELYFSGCKVPCAFTQSWKRRASIQTFHSMFQLDPIQHPVN